ncbi:TnsA-like heteromeric transposase endonuclease subunit [Amycolatopsis sp. NPDC059090]|uniref:TnsA-like heteromeric transposase endonuclease subunit n=1 Tax=Amycolatopsis sp. NPDC059090 TaxID=3346723 RepID=UPI0036706DA0
MASRVGPEASVRFRCSGSAAEVVGPGETIEVGALTGAAPWRTFRWREGQKHYSGNFWSATENDFVIYESRLELTRLLFADFDQSVQHIVAQPFMLQVDVDGVLRQHIPDYLLFTDEERVVVDVKPHHRVERPGNDFTFAWTRRARAIARLAL